jgi:hypothetical protein
MVGLPNEIYEVKAEQIVDLASNLSPVALEQLALGSVALGTMVCMTLLIREIRLLIVACKA